MGNLVSNNDSVFRWEYTDQPHADRRMQILRKHPEIKQLMRANGDPLIAVIGIAVAAVQILVAYTHDYITTLPIRIGLNIFVGSTLVSFLMLTLHEAAHCLLFGPNHPRLNRWYGLLLNLAFPVPVFTFFKRHHRRHHKYWQHKSLDAEMPTPIEANFFSRHPMLKYFWVINRPIWQSIRSPFLGDGTKDWLTWEEFTNIASCLAFSAFMISTCGLPVVTFMTFSVSMIGANLFGIWGWCVHTLFFDKEGTISYYGWLNPWILNAGYHMEHHDFPNVPARLLPEIRRIAPEFYEEQHQMDDLFAALVQWVHDPRLGVFSIIKRDDGGKYLIDHEYEIAAGKRRGRTTEQLAIRQG